MVIPDFLNPKLVGKRFESHSIPLEILGDLTVLEEMTIEAARWLYLQEHKDRKRSPRNFADGISLALSGVEDGSAIARITLVLAAASLIPTDQQIYLEQARDAIVGAIAAASGSTSPTDHLPSKVLTYFDRLGRSLLDDEAIEFPTHGRPGPPARLTKETRRRLLRAAQVTDHTEEIHIRGGIFDFNQIKFEIILLDGSKVPGHVGREHFDAILDASYGFKQGVKVLIDGVGRYSSSDRLQKIESIEHITLLDPLDFPSQLEELKGLRDGWYNGVGQAPSSAGLDWLALAFNTHYPDELALPYVYPVAEGRVRLEWPVGRVDISLEVDLHERSGDWHALNLDTDEEESRHLNLDHGEDWGWMAEQLRGVVEKPV